MHKTLCYDGTACLWKCDPRLLFSERLLRKGEGKPSVAAFVLNFLLLLLLLHVSQCLRLCRVGAFDMSWIGLKTFEYLTEMKKV